MTQLYGRIEKLPAYKPVPDENGRLVAPSKPNGDPVDPDGLIVTFRQDWPEYLWIYFDEDDALGEYSSLVKGDYVVFEKPDENCHCRKCELDSYRIREQGKPYNRTHYVEKLYIYSPTGSYIRLPRMLLGHRLGPNELRQLAAGLPTKIGNLLIRLIPDYSNSSVFRFVFYPTAI